MATGREIVNEVQRIVGEVAGIGVQVYSEDGTLEAVNRTFNTLFKNYQWRQFVTWFTGTLDGTTGTVDLGMASLGGLDDIVAVYRGNDPSPLPMWPLSDNPFSLSGTKVRFYDFLHVDATDADDKRLQFYPLEATDTVRVCAKINPGPFTWEDQVPLDKDLLVHGTAWQQLLGDDTNPGNAEAQRTLMDDRYALITRGLARAPIPMNSNDGIPSEWFVR